MWLPELPFFNYCARPPVAASLKLKQTTFTPLLLIPSRSRRLNLKRCQLARRSSIKFLTLTHIRKWVLGGAFFKAPSEQPTPLAQRRRFLLILLKQKLLDGASILQRRIWNRTKLRAQGQPLPASIEATFCNLLDYNFLNLGSRAGEYWPHFAEEEDEWLNEAEWADQTTKRWFKYVGNRSWGLWGSSQLPNRPSLWQRPFSKKLTRRIFVRFYRRPGLIWRYRQFVTARRSVRSVLTHPMYYPELFDTLYNLSTRRYRYLKGRTNWLRTFRLSLNKYFIPASHKRRPKARPLRIGDYIRRVFWTTPLSINRFINACTLEGVYRLPTRQAQVWRSWVTTNNFKEGWEGPTPLLFDLGGGLLFGLPPYGYRFITPPAALLNHPGVVTLRATIYSFSFYRDIKEFFLKKFNFQSRLIDFQTPPLGTSINVLNRTLLVKRECVKGWYVKRSGRSTHNNQRLLEDRFLFRIQRIRFKPGYTRIWRSARSALKFLFGLNFRYQRKLTRFLFQFYRYNRTSVLQSYELCVQNVLFYSSLVPDLITAQTCLNTASVYLNGRCCTNPQLVLRPNDTLQLLISYKYYLIWRWVQFLVQQNANKLNNFLVKKRVKLTSPSLGIWNERFPKWILQATFYNSDIPKYLEVDFFSLSLFLLYEPFLWSDYNPYNWGLIKTHLVNVYNWKYLT